MKKKNSLASEAVLNYLAYRLEQTNTPEYLERQRKYYMSMFECQMEIARYKNRPKGFISRLFSS